MTKTIKHCYSLCFKYLKLYLTALIATAILLASCSSSSNSTSNTTSGNNNSSTTEQGRSQSSQTVPTLPPLKTNNKVVKQFYNSLQTQSQAIFTATYNQTSNGQVTPLTLEQHSPDFLFVEGSKATGLMFIDTKTYSYECTGGDSTTPDSCIRQPKSSGGGSAQAVIQLFSGSYLATEMLQYAEVEHLSFTTSSKVIDGINSSCISFNYSGSNSMYCIQKDGIITEIYSGSGDKYILTNLTMSAPLGDFAPPAGANIQVVSG